MNLEQNELDSLLDKGVAFKVGKKSFTIQQPYIGTLDRLSDLYMQMTYDEEALNENGVIEANKIIRTTAKLWAMVAAVAVCNSKWKIKFMAPFMAKFFYWNMKPGDLKTLSELIMKMSGIVDFIISIRSIAGARTTKPNPIEQNKQA